MTPGPLTGIAPVLTAAAVLTVGISLLVGCSSDARSAAGEETSSTSTVLDPGASAAADSSPDDAAVADEPLALGPAPTTPIVQTSVAGHVATLEFRPGVRSGSVSEYEARVTAKGAQPQTGRLIDFCAANGTEATSCPLASQTRGTWDVWVRAIGKNGNSGWSLSTPIVIDSCTSADAKAGDCEVFDKGPGGGFVFYAAPWRESWGQYLEAAPSGWSGNALDPSAPLCDPTDGWGRVETRDGLGYGASNTQQIKANCGNTSAASIASVYRGGGLTDWFLPTGWELNLMYNMRSEIGGLTNTSGLPQTYWSSDRMYEYVYRAFNRDLANGKPSYELVNKKRGVRPIRAF